MKKIIAWSKSHKIFLLLTISLLFLLYIAFFAHNLAPFDPYEGNLRNAFHSPSETHYMGTDNLGRDIFSRVLYGIRISLSISIATITIITLIGGFFGVIAGYVGGIVDQIIMRISDVLISCPSMVLAISLAGIMGASVQNAMFAIFVVTISKYIRLTRSLVLQITSEEYIKAAKMSGTKNTPILTRHILPHIAQTLTVTATTDIGTIILELSALSFLGFGVPAPLPELGYMISSGRPHLLSCPWMVLFPGCAIFLIVSIFNLFSDKLQDLLG